MPTPAAAAPVASAPAAAPAGSAKPNGAAPVKPNPVGGAAAPKAAQTTPPPQSTAPVKHKWVDKIDGKEQEFEATDEDLRAAYRHRNASETRFQEAARLRKETAAEAERVSQTMAKIADKNEWFKALREAHPDADMTELLAERLQSLLAEEEQLQDPNIRERRRLEQENEGYRTKEAKAAEDAAAAEHEAEVKQHTERWAGLLKEGLALTKLPANDITLRFMAEAQHTARQRGWDLTPQQLAGAAEKGVFELVEGILSNEGTTDEQLLNFLPKLTQRIHKAIVAKFKAKRAGPGAAPDLTPRAKRPVAEEQKGPRVVSSQEEHKAYGIKGLRTL